jgi:epoxyqueuosine reductase
MRVLGKCSRYHDEVTADTVKALAKSCGFELAGVAAAEPHPDFARYMAWVENGHAGKMGYLTDRRAAVRADPRNLLPSARSIICVGKLYNTPGPAGPISRYAWGEDYHVVMRRGLERLATMLGEGEHKICIDTAPLLERSYAREAGLGWIGKNTCLINEPQGSWFFLGAIVTSLAFEPDSPPPDRCGTCTRCIDACPTQAIVPEGASWTVDSRRCISYLTIELHGPIPVEHRPEMGEHVFGCDICQEVCPWNSRAPETDEEAFRPRPLPDLATLSAEQFKTTFAGSPVLRAKHSGFLRNLAVAMGNAGNRQALEALAGSPDEVVADHARWALDRLRRSGAADREHP